MSVGKLLLHPRAVEMAPPPQAKLIAAMQSLGLFGDTLERDGGRPSFLAGRRFLQLITFLGCSPHINLEPPDDGKGEFCHLELLGPWQHPRFIQGRNTRPPGCPVCKRKKPEWRSLMEQQRIEGRMTSWTCDACGTQTPPSRWNWRQQAGFGRLLIQVSSIFPSEAVPTEELMSSLAALSGSPWQYFYIQD
jgi:hypothetical protein